MKADKVKGIAQFTACRVGCMVAVGKFIIVNYNTRRTLTRNKIISAGGICSRLIYTLKELINCRTDRKINTVEQTAHALFFKWVFLLFYIMVGCLAFLRCGRE